MIICFQYQVCRICIHPQNLWSQRNLWSFSCICNLLCWAFNCAVFVVFVHSVFRSHFFMIFFVYFRNNSYLCPWKQLVHGLGMCFQDILVWCAYGNASWRHHRHDIKKWRLRTLIFFVPNLVNLELYARR